MRDGDTQEARNWAMLCHLSSLFWFPALLLGLIGLPIPFVNIFAPLIVWLAKKNQDPFIDAHGKESLNFNISLTLYNILVMIIFAFLLSVTCGVGFSSAQGSTQNTLVAIGVGLALVYGVFVLVVFVYHLISVIFASIKAKKGEFYHYPYVIRFLR